MSEGELSNAAYDRIGGVLKRALTGLTVDQLKAQPAGPESNPIGWLAWHIARVQDKNFSALLKQKEAWANAKWCDKFGIDLDSGTGTGHSQEQVRAFDPVSSDLLLAYFEAARTKSREYLEKVTAEDLNRPSPEGFPSTEVIRVSVARVTGDLIQHVGQIAYIRGLVDKHGWYGA